MARTAKADADRRDLMEIDRIVGVGIWHGDDPREVEGHPSWTGEEAREGTDLVFAWNAAGIVSGGIPSNFAWFFDPLPFRTPASLHARDIVGVAISRRNEVHAWYGDGTWSKGTLTDLEAHQGPHPFELPGNRTASNIVAMAMLKTGSHVYTWFDDGRVSVGTPGDLGSRVGSGQYWSAEREYSLPGSRTPGDIAGMAIASDRKVFAWYTDGFASEGKSWDLDYHTPYAGRKAAPAPTRGRLRKTDVTAKPANGSLRPARSPYFYTRHPILRSTYPADLPSVRARALDPGDPISESTSGMVINKKSADNVVAVGGSLFAVALDASVRFYHRNGTPLTGWHPAPLEEMFAAFLPDPATGSTARLDVNNYLYFPRPCDTYPATRSHHFCVSGGPYDTRVEYDSRAGRWVIYANLRNEIYTSQFSNDPTQLAGAHTSFTSGYAPPQQPSEDEKMAEIPPEEGRLARRLKVFAVSRSDDPRDGFHVYAFVQNTYRDWPWMAIDGDHLILSHQGTRRSAADSPSATLLPLEDVRAGKVRPSFVNFYPRDLGDVFKAEPPRQFGSLPDHSLLVGKRPGEGGDGPWWHVFALPHPGRPYEKRTPGSAVLDDPRIDVSALMEERTAFRDGLLHFTGQRTRKKHHGVHHNEIVYYRVGLTMDGDRPVLSYDEPGFRTMKWGDDLDESTPRSFDQPGVQVNSAGDVFVTFGRGGAADGPFVSEPADVMYTLWQHAAVVPAPITLWKEGVEGYDREHTHTVPRKVKALAAAVDPMDGTTFWGIHRFRAKDGSWDTFVGAFTP